MSHGSKGAKPTLPLLCAFRLKYLNLPPRLLFILGLFVDGEDDIYTPTEKPRPSIREIVTQRLGLTFRFEEQISELRAESSPPSITVTIPHSTHWGQKQSISPRSRRMLLNHPPLGEAGKEKGSLYILMWTFPRRIPPLLD